MKVVSLEGEAVRPVARVPHSARGIEALVAAVAAAVPRPEQPIGLAVAGLVRGRSVVRSGNLGLADAPLAEAIERRLGVPLVAFVSDAHAVGRAALREAATEDIIIALALGTGVGGALIERGRIVRDEGLGHGTLAGEPAAAPCALGHDRCLEAHLGAAALARALSVPEAATVDRLAEAGDARARAVLESAGALAARCLAPLARGSSARLVLSGGVASSPSLLRGFRSSFPGEVVLSRHGSYTAAAGAAFAVTPP